MGRDRAGDCGAPGSAAPDFRDMPFAAQLVTWGMRSWVAACLRQAPVSADVPAAFARAGAGEAWSGLDSVFGILAAVAVRPLDIRCIGCRRVSEDEIALLDLVAAVQQGDVTGVAERLAGLLPPAAARLALDGVEQWAHGLRAAGLHLAPRRLPAGSGRWPAMADGGVHRLH